jgi:hypothetical protein
MNPTMDAIYLLSPQPHIVDCVLADFERRRYRRSYLVWTGVLDPQLRRRIDLAPHAQQLLAGELVSWLVCIIAQADAVLRFRNAYHRLLSSRIAPHHLPRPVELPDFVPSSMQSPGPGSHADLSTEGKPQFISFMFLSKGADTLVSATSDHGHLCRVRRIP